MKKIYLTQTEKTVIAEIKAYFKKNHISRIKAGEMLGCTPQTVTNRLYVGRFTPVTAALWAKTFGFEERFILEGKGCLVKKSRGYKKVVNENGALNAIVRSQKIVIDKLVEENKALKEEVKRLKGEGVGEGMGVSARMEVRAS